MAFLGTLSVRTLPVGGPVAMEAAQLPAGWMLGHRHVILLVHGYNVDQQHAIQSYQAVFTAALSEVGYFFWPGDASGGTIISTGSYPWEIPRAKESALRLADFLRGLFGPGGGPTAVSLVGHSLGCRVILELLKIVTANPALWPEFRLVSLMAAAVPVDLAQFGADLQPGTRVPRSLQVFYSFSDRTLEFAFPPGQFAAFALGFEVADFGRAIGRYGEPTGLTPDRIPVDLDHGDYWPSQSVADRVSQALGVSGPRPLPGATVLSRQGPPVRSLPPGRSLPSRTLLSGQVAP
jgi:hypothetical protein